MSECELIAAFDRITRPAEFVKLFGDEAEFLQWLKLGSKEDLQYTLKEFEQAELYEYCGFVVEEIAMRRIIQSHQKQTVFWKKSRTK